VHLRYLYHCNARYGRAWELSHRRQQQAATENKSILDLFTIGRGKKNRPTEQIFVERCLNPSLSALPSMPRIFKELEICRGRVGHYI
jgi:hypothetical protein